MPVTTAIPVFPVDRLVVEDKDGMMCAVISQTGGTAATIMPTLLKEAQADFPDILAHETRLIYRRGSKPGIEFRPSGPVPHTYQRVAWIEGVS